jgi:serine/threonine protein kinase
MERGQCRSSILKLAHQLLSAACAMHDCRIIHADIRPENILLRRAMQASSSARPCRPTFFPSPSVYL